MTPGRAEEKEFLAIGHRCVGLANELAEKGMAFKLSLSYGTFIFSMDTTGSTQLPRRRKKCPSAIIRDKRRRMEFLKRKKSTSCPSPPLSLDRLSIEASWTWWPTWRWTRWLTRWPSGRPTKMNDHNWPSWSWDSRTLLVT